MRDFIRAGGFDALSTDIYELLKPELTSLDPEERTRAAMTWRALSIVEQMTRAISFHENDVTES